MINRRPSTRPRRRGTGASPVRLSEIDAPDPHEPPDRTPNRELRTANSTGAITAIERQERRLRFNVFIDGAFAIALEPDTLVSHGLRVGLVVTAARLTELADADLKKRALDGALRLLASRPRSEAEVRQRLARRELPPEVIDHTVMRLREFGYVNDDEFARFWVESRSGANPRGRYVVRRELHAKGVDAETADTAMESLADADAALRAGTKKARSLRGLDYPEFRNRLTAYLVRRGFSYDVVRGVVNGLWRGAHGEIPDEAE